MDRFLVVSAISWGIETLVNRGVQRISGQIHDITIRKGVSAGAGWVMSDEWLNDVGIGQKTAKNGHF